MPNDATRLPNKTKFREGYPTSAEQLTRIIDMLARRIMGDNKTIQVRTFPGGQIVIKAINKSGRGTGPKQEQISFWVRASSPEDFPDYTTLPDTTLGRIISGDDEGVIYVIGPNGWEPINKLE